MVFLSVYTDKSLFKLEQKGLTMNAKQLLGICYFFGLAGCGTIPTDPTPPWADSNRFGMLIENDCNTVTKSVGLSGCAFNAEEINSNVFFPVLWSGNITMTSQNCKNVTMLAGNQFPNVLQIVDLYTNPSWQNCGFEITRTIRDGKFTADKTMIGRFFVKIMPKNSNVKKMKFAIGKDTFSGVGWHQKKTDKLDVLFTRSAIPVNVTVYPYGTRGIFRASCDGENFLQVDYDKGPFTFAFDRDENCDLEMTTRSADSPFVSTGTLLWEVQTMTVDLTPPSVAIKRSKITFTFNDKDASGKTPVVYGVWVDGTPCKQTNKCTVTNQKNRYFVQGFTLSARPFYGYYSVNTKTWEIL